MTQSPHDLLRRAADRLDSSAHANQARGNMSGANTDAFVVGALRTLADRLERPTGGMTAAAWCSWIKQPAGTPMTLTVRQMNEARDMILAAIAAALPEGPNE